MKNIDMNIQRIWFSNLKALNNPRLIEIPLKSYPEKNLFLFIFSFTQGGFF